MELQNLRTALNKSYNSIEKLLTKIKTGEYQPLLPEITTEALIMALRNLEDKQQLSDAELKKWSKKLAMDVSRFTD